MKMWMRVTCVLVAAGVLGGAMLISKGTAGDDPKVLLKTVDSIAEALKGGKKDAATKQAKQLAENQEEVYYVMLTLKPRDKNGSGIGAKPGAIKPDGIEFFIREVDKGNVPNNVLTENAPAMEELAYRSAAIAEFSMHDPVLSTHALTAAKKKEWLEYAKDMQSSAMEAAAAAKKKDGAAMKAALSKLNASCNKCHAEFR